MGGGDLNLKKSWHPQTMKNQERVWKAEQAKSQEQKRLNELRKEIDEEKNREELRRIGESSGVLAKSDADKKLEWMYKSSTELVNREEYLLGRSIDKTFETLQAEEQRKEAGATSSVRQPINHVEHECIPFSIRDYRGLETNEQVDLQRKVMEDPLMLIKQREMESRRKLLENPVKLKELHRILKTDHNLGSSKKVKKAKKSKKSKKSKKKHKKRSKSSDSSESSTENEDNSDEGEDLDAALAKKYNKLKGSMFVDGNEMKNISLTKLLDAKYDTISKELDKAAGVKCNNKRYQRDGSSSSDERSSNNRRPVGRYDNRRDFEHKSASRSRYRSRSRERNNYRRDRSRSRSRSRARSPVSRNSRNIQNNRRQRSRSRSPIKTHNQSFNANSSKPSKPNRLTEEEKEARRREMMENAAWRESDRSQAVKRQRDAYEQEEKQNTSREFDKNFINKEVKKAIANHATVESRIRSNLNNIQRTTSSMNSNFARK